MFTPGDQSLLDDLLAATSPFQLLTSIEELCDYIDRNDLNLSIPSDFVEQSDQTKQRTDDELTIENLLYQQHQEFFSTISDDTNYSKNRDDSSTILEQESYPQNIDSRISHEDSTDEIRYDAEEWSVRDVIARKIRPPKLHEFLRLLLDNDRYASYASWLDKNTGLFKIHKPAHVASLWRKIKIRKPIGSLDYDIFARSIRYYYKSGLMIRTHTKYTYRFAQV